MILIHTALLCEAQTFIEEYKLEKINTKIYKNNKIILLISGIGKENTISTLDYMFLHYNITKALNIGIAGANDLSINIGDLFCTNHNLLNIKYLDLITVDKVQTNSENNDNIILYDMEAKYFKNISLNYVDKDKIFIFKVVSDYLDSEILKKDYIKSLIKKNLKKLKPYIIPN